jgi:hypothetical protein
VEMTSSFLMLVISLISLWEGKGQVPRAFIWSSPGAPGTGHAMHPQVGRARLT